MIDASADATDAEKTMGTTMEFEYSETLTPSVAVAETIADVTDTEPDEGTPLHDVVDTDALNTLLFNSDAVSVSFTYDDHEVTVDDAGTVTVEPRISRS